MSNQNPRITGALLAGGLARRMDGVDKGLMQYQDRPLATYALKALETITASIVINANRNQSIYAAFGYPVVSDTIPGFIGPLAGLLAAMKSAHTLYLLAIPCDCPHITREILSRLCDAPQEYEIVTLHDGIRMHPVFMRVNRSLADSLENYLMRGERKVADWIAQHHYLSVDCSDLAENLTNINTLQQLQA